MESNTTTRASVLYIYANGVCTFSFTVYRHIPYFNIFPKDINLTGV